MELRVCRKCNVEKAPTEFYDRKRNGKPKRQFTCKPCEKIRMKEWRDSNPEANKAIYTRSRYKTKYGLNVEDVPKVGDCPICLRTDLKLVVDHCHTHGHVRGFICYSCNTLLGHVENKEKMTMIEKYLTSTGPVGPT